MQISWHGSDPVLTLDFHRSSGLLATGGADHDIKLWTLRQADDGALPSATFESSLSYHTAAVNVVRFSSIGDQLASGADGGEILLWKLVENSEVANTWKLAKNLRFHVKDVLDLELSPDGTLLVSGSVDNTVIIWDAQKGIPKQVLKDHMHYVQGVAWDPAGHFVASISGDRTCRIYTNRPQNSKTKSQENNMFSCQNVLFKEEEPKENADTCISKVSAAKHNLFHDETLPSFFRRLAWSPDGSFLLVPSGIHKFASDSVLSNTAFIFSRKDLSRPAMQLPGASKPIIAVRFCPVIFSLLPNKQQKSDDGPASVTEAFKLPYRLLFAVATLNSLFVYDTQSAYPLAVFAGLHYAAITDIAWSWDAKFIAVSSQDGFCTLVAFDYGELGIPLPLNEIPSHIARYLPWAKEVVLQGRVSKNLSATFQTDTASPLISTGNDIVSASNGHLTTQDEETCKKHNTATQATTLDVEPVPQTQHTGSTITSELGVSGTQKIVKSQVQVVKPRRITPTAITVDSAPSQLQASEVSRSLAK